MFARLLWRSELERRRVQGNIPQRAASCRWQVWLIGRPPCWFDANSARGCNCLKAARSPRLRKLPTVAEKPNTKTAAWRNASRRFQICLVLRPTRSACSADADSYEKLPLCGWRVHCCLVGTVRAMAQRCSHDPVRRQGAIPVGTPVPCQCAARRPVASLESQRVCRHAPDRRSPIADLLACDPACVFREDPKFSATGFLRACVARHRWIGGTEVLPGPGMASGRRHRCRPGICIRCVGGLAHPAHRAYPEPCLLRGGPVAAVAHARQVVPALWRARRGRNRHDDAGAQPGCAPRRLCPRRLLCGALAFKRRSPRRAARER